MAWDENMVGGSIGWRPASNVRLGDGEGSAASARRDGVSQKKECLAEKGCEGGCPQGTNSQG